MLLECAIKCSHSDLTASLMPSNSESSASLEPNFVLNEYQYMKLLANKFALERFDRFEHLIETECGSGGIKYTQSVKIFSIICTLIQHYYLFSAIHKKNGSYQFHTCTSQTLFKSMK